MKERVRVRFIPGNVELTVERGSLLSEAAARAGVVLSMSCGGLGICGKCRVKVEPVEAVVCESKGKLSEKEWAEGYRLACMSRVAGDVSVEVPEESRFYVDRIVAWGKGRRVKLSPGVTKRVVRFEKAGARDTRGHVSRLLSTAGLGRDVRVSVSAVRDMGDLLGKEVTEATCVLMDGDLVGIEDGETGEKNFGLALDVGTTTVAAKLVRLSDGEEAATVLRVNPQRAFSDDVVGRVAYADSMPGGLSKLHRSIIECINGMIREACVGGECEAEDIYDVVVVGNTVMLLLLLGVNPSVVGRAPYAAIQTAPAVVKARSLGLRVNREARVRSLPCVAGFLGADAISAALATGLAGAEGPEVVIDMGTNTETLLCAGGRMVACSAAAGPAFEGGRISCGMSALRGAIDSVRIGERVSFTTIGDAPARGICGSGVVDAVAELRKAGVIEASGRMLHTRELPREIPRDVRERVRPGAGGPEFAIAREEEGMSGRAVTLTQRDVREFQLAKGAVHAALSILLREAGVRKEELTRIMLAGGFGSYLRRESALAVGLLPRVEPERIMFVGNAACEGARMVLTCRELMEEAERVAEGVNYIELAGRADFTEAFSAGMMLQG